MTCWYKESFGHQYLELYSHRDAIEAEADIQSIFSLISPQKNEPLLDLACGAGRHLISLYRLGFTHLTGLDLSAELLQAAEKSLKESYITDIALVRADMRHIPYRDCFTTILSLFTSFGYFAEDSENEKVIESVYRALKAGGMFLIDYLNRDQVISNLVAEEEIQAANRIIKIFRRLTVDHRRVEKIMKIITDEGSERQFYESVRLYTADEMTGMLRDHGFKNICCYGSLNGKRFESRSERLVIITEKRTQDD